MTEMFGEAWPPMSVPDLAPDDDDDRLPIVSLVTSYEETKTFLQIKQQELILSLKVTN